MPHQSLITLGREYKDKVTGLKGIAVSTTLFLYSCERVAIQPYEIKDGKPVDGSYFDVHQLEDIGPGISVQVTAEVSAIASQRERTGGFGEGATRPVPAKR